jgi:hypothetical protein
MAVDYFHLELVHLHFTFRSGLGYSLPIIGFLSTILISVSAYAWMGECLS